MCWAGPGNRRVPGTPSIADGEEQGPPYNSAAEGVRSGISRCLFPPLSEGHPAQKELMSAPCLSLPRGVDRPRCCPTACRQCCKVSGQVSSRLEVRSVRPTQASSGQQASGREGSVALRTLPEALGLLRAARRLSARGCHLPPGPSPGRCGMGRSPWGGRHTPRPLLQTDGLTDSGAARGPYKQFSIYETTHFKTNSQTTEQDGISWRFACCFRLPELINRPSAEVSLGQRREMSH